MLLAEEVEKADEEDSGIGRLVIGEGKVVNNGGDGGDEEGSKGFLMWSSGEGKDNKDVIDVAFEEGGGIGSKLDKASDTFGFG